MSYILDALKKSEQERGHGNIPDVQTVHSSSLNYRSEKKTYWPYILITAVLLNLLAIIYFIVSKENPTETAGTTQPTTITSHEIIENIPATEEIAATESPVAISNDDSEKKTVKNLSPKPEEKTIEIKNKTAKKTEAVAAIPEKPTVSEPAPIIDFHELPESIKQELPSIVISAHVYSSNPMQRSIVINNNLMEEGEYVLDGLILNEITPDGAIFNYQGTLFSYGVVSSWQ